MYALRFALLASVALLASQSGRACAQEVKAAEIGDAEATLPPVVITAPKEKIEQASKPAAKKYKPVEVDDEPAPPKKAKAKSKSAPSQSAAAAEAQGGGSGGGGGGAGAGGASGEGDGSQPADVGSSSGIPGVFTLGQIDMVGGTAISNEAMRTFSKDTLDKALSLAPGVAASNSGGSRNEQLIFVRGFDRWQVPLSIDGIRIYRPADNARAASASVARSGQPVRSRDRATTHR